LRESRAGMKRRSGERTRERLLVDAYIRVQRNRDRYEAEIVPRDSHRSGGARKGRRQRPEREREREEKRYEGHDGRFRRPASAPLNDN